MQKYSTIWLIENLRKEVANLVPFELYRGKLAYWKLSKYIYDINSKKDMISYKKLNYHVLI
jgi:hypothetical protein